MRVCVCVRTRVHALCVYVYAGITCVRVCNTCCIAHMHCMRALHADIACIVCVRCVSVLHAHLACVALRRRLCVFAVVCHVAFAHLCVCACTHALVRALCACIACVCVCVHDCVAYIWCMGTCMHCMRACVMNLCVLHSCKPWDLRPVCLCCALTRACAAAEEKRLHPERSCHPDGAFWLYAGITAAGTLYASVWVCVGACV